jgi:hypothetical protein
MSATSNFAGPAKSSIAWTAWPSSAANPDDKENVFIVTGDSGNGLTHGTIAGMLLRDPRKSLDRAA